MDLILNKNRFNKGSKFGLSLLRRAIQTLGFGRSVLVDKDNIVLAGNDVYRIAKELGANIRVIETDGNELIVVKRKDVSAGERKGKELSLTDNLTQEKNLTWDADVLLKIMNSEYDGFDPRRWNGHSCLVKELNIEDLFNDSYLPPQPKQEQQESVNHCQLNLFD